MPRAERGGLYGSGRTQEEFKAATPILGGSVTSMRPVRLMGTHTRQIQSLADEDMARTARDESVECEYMDSCAASRCIRPLADPRPASQPELRQLRCRRTKNADPGKMKARKVRPASRKRNKTHDSRRIMSLLVSNETCDVCLLSHTAEGNASIESGSVRGQKNLVEGNPRIWRRELMVISLPQEFYILLSNPMKTAKVDVEGKLVIHMTLQILASHRNWIPTASGNPGCD